MAGNAPIRLKAFIILLQKKVKAIHHKLYAQLPENRSNLNAIKSFKKHCCGHNMQFCKKRGIVGNFPPLEF